MKFLNIKTAKTEKELKQAIKDLVHNRHRLTVGEISATRVALIDRAREIGVSWEALNKYAEECAS